MKLKVLDWRGKPTEWDIGDLEDIGRIFIRVLSGDEVAVVIYKNYDFDEFDSSHDRTHGFPDGEYDIYWPEHNVNLLNDPKFLNRKSSYWILEGA